MSVRTMARVWEDSQHGGTELLMLLAIADFADDQGTAYPSVATLAEKCRMKPRNANYILAALQESGELQVRQNKGVNGTNRYRNVLESLGAKKVQPVAVVQSPAGVQCSALTPATECASPLQSVADKLSVNHQEPSEKASSPRPSARKPSRRKTGQTFSTWLAEIRAVGEQPVPSGDPIFEYSDTVGIPFEFLEIAWKVFKADHTTSDKVQADWRATFRNYVRKGYLKLWFSDKLSGECMLTQAGIQAAREHGFRSSSRNDPFAGAL